MNFETDLRGEQEEKHERAAQGPQGLNAGLRYASQQCGDGCFQLRGNG